MLSGISHSDAVIHFPVTTSLLLLCHEDHSHAGINKVSIYIWEALLRSRPALTIQVIPGHVDKLEF